MDDNKWREEWNETIRREKCDGVDMETGLKDCWNFLCMKNHTWRYYEIHNQPERLSEKTSKDDAIV